MLCPFAGSLTPHAGFGEGGDCRESEAIAQTLVARGSVWSYLADGSNQGTAWRGVGFADASWPSGISELGYGDGDEDTDVGFVDVNPGQAGDQKNATTYFRKQFQLDRGFHLVQELPVNR